MPWRSEMKFYSRLCSKWLPEGECLLLSANAARLTAWLQQGSLTSPSRWPTMGKANTKSRVPVWYFLVEEVDLLPASSRTLSSPQSRACWTTLCYRASSLRILTPWSPLGAFEGCSSSLWLRTRSCLFAGLPPGVSAMYLMTLLEDLRRWTLRLLFVCVYCGLEYRFGLWIVDIDVFFRFQSSQ